MVNTKDYIENGGFFVFNNWLNVDDYLEIEKIFEYKDMFKPKHQPHGIPFGNRLQAFPTYESNLNPEIEFFIFNKIKEQLNIDIKDFFSILRFVDNDEVKKSKRNGKYPSIHRDEFDIAGVLYFDQTVDGGTAFFGVDGDSVPEFVVGAYPNRLIVYNGQVLHTPMNDFTYDMRKCLVFFANFV